MKLARQVAALLFMSLDKSSRQRRPLARPARFLIVDRIGPGDNLEEFRYPEPWTVTAG